MTEEERNMFLQRISELKTMKTLIGVTTTPEATFLAVNLEGWIDQLIENLQLPLGDAQCK